MLVSFQNNQIAGKRNQATKNKAVLITPDKAWQEVSFKYNQIQKQEQPVKQGHCSKKGQGTSHQANTISIRD